MDLGAELAVVAAFGLHRLEAGADHFGEHLLGLNERDLDVAVRVAVVAELHLDSGRQRAEHRGGFGGEVLRGEGDLVALLHRIDLGGVGGEQVVEFGDQHLDLRDELDESFRNQRDAEVHSGGGPGGDHHGDLLNDLGEGHLLRRDLFGDDRDVRLSLECALQRDVGSGTAHQFDEVPVLLGGVCVAADVADEFAVDAAGGVEAEARLDPLVLEVAVDGLRAADHLDRNVVALEVFGEHAGVGVGVVAADDDQCADAEHFAVAAGRFELLIGFELGPAGADHVEAAGVAVGVDHVGGELHVFVADQPVGPLEEAVEAAVRMDRFQAVEESGDDVVAAGGLAAGEDHADIDRLPALRVGIGFKGERGAAEGGLEDLADLLQVGDGGGRGAFDDADHGAVSQRGREFRGIGGTRLLEGRDLIHGDFLEY